MAKYSTEFKMKVIKEYLESSISYKSLSDKYGIPSECMIKRWVNTYKSQQIQQNLSTLKKIKQEPIK